MLGSVLGAVYTARLVLPAGLDPGEREAAGTLGGAFDLADRLPPDPATALTDSAREAFTAGMDLTAGIGVGVMLAAAALVAVVWPRPPAGARPPAES